MGQPSVVYGLPCSSLIFLVKILVANLDHLRGWSIAKDPRHSVGQNCHEVLLGQLLELWHRDEPDKLILVVVVKGEVNLADGRKREEKLWVN